MAGFAAIKSDWISGVLTFFKRSDNSKVMTISRHGVGRMVTSEDQDAQNATYLVAQMDKGLLIHTSTSSGGTLTVDTAANLAAAYPEWQIGEVREFYYQNDGTQTVTLTGASGTTRVSAQTIATLQGRRICFLRTAADAWSVWAD